MDELKTKHESNPSNETLNNLENAIADLDSYDIWRKESREDNHQTYGKVARA